VLFIDFKYSNNRVLNYAVYYNTCFFIQRLLCVFLIVLEPIYEFNSAYILQTVMVSAMIFSSIVLHFNLFIDNQQMLMFMINQIYIIIVCYLLLVCYQITEVDQQEMVDNILVYSIYLIFGYHALYIYAGALLQFIKYQRKKIEDR